MVAQLYQGQIFAFLASAHLTHSFLAEKATISVNTAHFLESVLQRPLHNTDRPFSQSFFFFV